MKVLGRVPGNEYILDKTDGKSALRLVTQLPTDVEDAGSMQLENDVGNDRRGSIFIGNGNTWEKIVQPDTTVGPIQWVVCPREGCDVKIRWRDPVDTSECIWKHTLLMRKYGTEAPKSIHDGVIVTDSYVRNQYVDQPLHDILPEGTEDKYTESDGMIRQWHYRFFTFTEDGTMFTSSECTFEPIELTWRTLPAIIRDGLVSRVLHVGDELYIGNNNVNDQIYGNLIIEVAGIDQAAPEDRTLTNSVTFLARYVFGYKCPFDIFWKEYQLTSDTHVTSRTKEYYRYNNGVYELATNLRLGQKIEPGTLYERNTSQDRVEHGGNKWSSSAIRSWLNSTDPENKLVITKIGAARTMQFSTHGVIEGYISPPLTQLPSEVTAVITPVRNITAVSRYDGGTYDVSIDKIYLLSKTEVFNTTNDRIDFVLTSDENPIDGKEYYVIDATSKVYRLAEDKDFDGEGAVFKPDVKYYDKIVTATKENEPTLGLFRQEADGSTELESRKRTSYDDETTFRSWWLRSCNIETPSTVKAVNEEGGLIDGGNGAEDLHCLVFAFSVA